MQQGVFVYRMSEALNKKLSQCSSKKNTAKKAVFCFVCCESFESFFPQAQKIPSNIECNCTVMHDACESAQQEQQLTVES